MQVTKIGRFVPGMPFQNFSNNQLISYLNELEWLRLRLYMTLWFYFIQSATSKSKRPLLFKRRWWHVFISKKKWTSKKWTVFKNNKNLNSFCNLLDFLIYDTGFILFKVQLPNLRDPFLFKRRWWHVFMSKKKWTFKK